MRETFSEWECMSGSAPGLIESMDAAGFSANVDPPQGRVEGAAAMQDAGVYAFHLPPEDAIPCLDLRHLPAPEPLERAIAAADALAPGAKLEVWTPMLPVPLLQLLDARGFRVRAELLKDGTTRIFVERVNA
jgi:hypothetical protein